MSRAYKRSWKNLLINKDYQLRMTIVLVGVIGLLMSGLGWWVMSQARTATEVAINNVEGTHCELPAHLEQAGDSPVVVGEITEMSWPPAYEPQPLDAAGIDGGKSADAAPALIEEESGSADEADAEDAERPRPTITTSKMTIDSADDEDPSAAAALLEVDAEERDRLERRYHDCQLAKRAQIANLQGGEAFIFRILVVFGLTIVIGLAVYGIKMTHRVAGPLFKITLYLRKLKNGTYDTVYNLRKGDQLVEFYEHFKSAHRGAKKMQEDDIDHLRRILAMAEKHDLSGRSAEIKAAIVELRVLLEEKEKSIV